MGSSTQFLARGRGYSLSLNRGRGRGGPGSAPRRASDHGARGHSDLPERTLLRMQLAQANPAPGTCWGWMSCRERSTTSSADDPPDVAHRRSHLRQCVPRVYPGIDLVYYGNRRPARVRLRRSRRGPTPASIRLGFRGGGASLDYRGRPGAESRAAAGSGQRRPVLYQEVTGSGASVAGRYEARGPRQVGFAVGAYDAAAPLVIDPVLAYSSYLGGCGADKGAASRWTRPATPTSPAYHSPNFPTTLRRLPRHPRRPTSTPSSPSSTPPGRRWSTPPTSAAAVLTRAVASRSTRRATPTSPGSTASTDFPTTAGALQTPAPTSAHDAFVTKMNAAGTACVYSTYLGGKRRRPGRRDRRRRRRATPRHRAATFDRLPDDAEQPLRRPAAEASSTLSSASSTRRARRSCAF